MVNLKSNFGSLKKGNVNWNKNRRINLDLEKIEQEHINGKSILNISKELGVSDSLIRIRMKEENRFIRKNTEPTERTKQKIRETLIRKKIQPKQRYSGPPWNKGKKGLQIPWNKDKVGLQKSEKKGKTYEELYGEERSGRYKKIIKERREKQIFPVKDTSIEIKMQNFLKQLGIEFFTHQYIKEIEHGYQCDILIPIQKGIFKKTIIECFGDYWHNYPYARKIDNQRCKELRDNGWRVLCFWECEIKPIQLKVLKEKLLV